MTTFVLDRIHHPGPMDEAFDVRKGRVLHLGLGPGKRCGIQAASRYQVATASVSRVAAAIRREQRVSHCRQRRVAVGRYAVSSGRSQCAFGS